jgi:hypothetical protein
MDYFPEYRVDGISGTDTVPVDKCNKAILKGIGQLIYDAARSDAAFQNLRAETARSLVGAGVPATSIQNMQIYVFKDEPTLLNIIVPEVTDMGNTPSDEYLVELGLVTVRACKHA